MNILRNLIIAYLLIGLVIVCIIQFIIILKIGKHDAFSYGIATYIIAYFYGIIKQVFTIAVWPLFILGYFWFLKDTDIDTLNEMCKKFEDERD